MNAPTPAPVGSEAVADMSDRLARLSTGAKMFALLSLALLPLGLILFLASLQTNRNVDLERRSALRVAVSESARRLGSEIAVDTGTLRGATQLLARGEAPEVACARVRDTLSTASGEPTAFVISGPDGRALCGTPGVAAPPPRMVGTDSEQDVAIDTQKALLRIDLPPTGGYRASAIYPREQLARIAAPADFAAGYRLDIGSGPQFIPLVDTFRAGAFERTEAMTVAVPRIGASLTMEVHAAPFTSSQMLTMLMPILMWASAAAIGWLVVDRMLLRPLGELRRAIASYQPGLPFGAGRRLTTPAREIRELGETFRTITETVAAHEAELARGLSRQTRLTREVHHRVKNNLQVIASLISLHARSARSTEAADAYASIQRRVDALAVVHRNHYAELEESRGIPVRSLLGELAANLRSTALSTGGPLHIHIEAAPYYVTQDVAVALAFIVTELVELSMLGDPTMPIGIRVSDNDGRSRLTVRSEALAGRHADSKLKQKYARILEGLARQLRSSLAFDAGEGSYSLGFPNSGAE